MSGDHSVDPRRYFESVERDRAEIAGRDPVCLYLETTNRCNLPCTTCPRTFEELEPAANMSWDLFRSIVDQYPKIARVVLHGVGEPLMVPNLPRMVRYLKVRGTYVLFNTNGTLLNERRGRDLIDSGLDELRVSLDAAEPQAFKAVRGKDAFDRIVANVRNFRALQRTVGAETPRVSLWLTGLKETIAQLPAFVDLAHSIDVSEVHLQRLVYFPGGQGLASPEQALFERLEAREEALIRQAAARAAELAVRFDASGATEPGTSLKRTAEERPWSLCTRPWHTARRCRAASPRSRCAATTPSRSVMRPKIRCAIFGMERNTGRFDAICSARRHRPAAPIAACGGACRQEIRDRAAN